MSETPPSTASTSCATLVGSSVSATNHPGQVRHLAIVNTNGEHLLQKGGTSMGTDFGPSYANIFVAKLEEEAIRNYHPNHLCGKGFFDDVFCILTHDK